MSKIIVIRKRNVFGIVLCILLFVIVGLNLGPVMREVASVATTGSKKLPIYCVKRDDNKISISFDAAWGADDTDKLLQILKDNNVRATFFVCGYWVDKYPEEVKKILADGHDLGNHGNTHAHGAKLTFEQNKDEITKVHDKVKNLTGYEMKLFRPPYGEYNNTVIEATESVGYYPIQWDVDSLDWKGLGTAHEINQVVNHKKLGSGSIVLFHNDAKYTPDVLNEIIEKLRDKDFELVPISELIHKSNYHMDHEGRQIVN